MTVEGKPTVSNIRYWLARGHRKTIGDGPSEETKGIGRKGRW